MQFPPLISDINPSNYFSEESSPYFPSLFSLWMIDYLNIKFVNLDEWTINMDFWCTNSDSKTVYFLQYTIQALQGARQRIC